MAFDPTENRAARGLRRRDERGVRQQRRQERRLTSVSPQALAERDAAGPFKKGLRAGAGQLEASIEGVKGIANTLIGDEEAAAVNQANADTALQRSAEVAPRIREINDIESARDLADYVKGTFGQVLPIAAPLVAGGPLGVATKALTRANVSSRTAAIGGALTGSTGVESGLIFNELQDPDVDTDLTPREKAFTALGFGTAAGALDVLPVLQVFDKFGVKKAGKRAIERSILRDTAKGAGQSAVLEGGTEGLQTIIERAAVRFADENKEIFSEEGLNEIINAIAAGAIVGTGFGGLGSAVASATSSEPGAPGITEKSPAGGGLLGSIEQKLQDIEANEELLGAGVRGTAGKIRETFFGLGRADLAADIDAAASQTRTGTADDSLKFAREISAYQPIIDVLETMSREDQAGISNEGINRVAAYINAPTDVGFDIIRADAEAIFGPNAQTKIGQIREDLIGVNQTLVDEFFALDQDTNQEFGVTDEESITSDVSRETIPGVEVDFSKPARFLHRRSIDGLEINSREDLHTAATARAEVKRLTGADKVVLGESIQEQDGPNVFTIVPAREGIMDRNRAAGGMVLAPADGEGKYVIKAEKTAVSELAEPERQLAKSDLEVGTIEQIGTGNVVHRDKVLRRFNKQSDIDNKTHFSIDNNLAINVPALTKKMIQKRGSAKITDTELIKAFIDGYISLSIDHGYSAKQLSQQLKKDTVIFFRGRDGISKPVLFSDVSGLLKANNIPVETTNDRLFRRIMELKQEESQETIDRQEPSADLRKPQTKAEERANVREIEKKGREERAAADKVRTPSHKKKGGHTAAIRQMFNDVSKILGFEGMELLDTAAAREWAWDNNKPQLRADLKAGRIHGFNIGKVVYVNPQLTPRQQLATLAHELGHVLHRDLFERLDKTGPTYKAIMEEYIAWAGIAQDQTLTEALFSRGSQLYNINDAYAVKGGVLVKDLPSKERAYVLDFEEWFSDQLSLYIINENIKPANKNQAAIKKFALRLKKFLADIIADVMPGAAPQTHRFFAAVVTARQSRGYRAHVSEIVGDIKFARKINSSGARGRKGNNILLSAAMQQDPYSIESLTHAADFLSKYLTTAEQRVLNRALSRRETQKKIEELTDSANLPLDLYHAVAFQMWMDNKLFIGPQTRSIFHKVMDGVRQVLGLPNDDLLARSILMAVANGGITSASRSFNIDQVGKARIHKTRAAKVAFDALQIATPYIKSFGYTADSQMRSNPVFRSIMDQFHARVGTEGINRTYFEERTQMRGRFDDILQHILAPLAQADVDAVFKAAQKGYDTTGLTTKQEKALRQLNGLFKEANQYLVEARALSNINPKKYFPRVYDYDFMRHNKQQFVDMLNSKYTQKLKEYAHALHKIEVKEYGAQHATSVKDLQATMAQRIYDWIMANDGNVETTIQNNPALTVSTGFVNSRKFDWIKDADLQPFMSTDFNFIMSTYVDKAVKTAAFQRRFGPGEINQLIDSARKLGATDAEVEQAIDAVNALLGRAGIKNNKKLHSMFGRVAPPGQVINPTLQKAMSAIMVARNMMVLGLATFTSLVDPLGILVRSGDFGTAWEALKVGGGEIRQGVKNLGSSEKQKTEATLLAQTLGTIDIYATQAALEWEYGGTYMTGGFKKINEWFFKAIGLTQWTTLTRTMATTAAIDFIKKHADGNYNKHSMRYLAQLNLVPQDLVRDADGELVLLKHAEILDATPTERARDARVKNAITRFVDESILRPNAAQRPIWASDPHYMLVFHLQSFMYSFHDRILRRVYTEYADHQNVVPAMMLMSFPLMMLAVNDLRDEVKYLGDDNPRKANWGVHDHLFEAMDRSGIFGVGGNMIMSAKTDTEYGGFGFESRLGALGPTTKNILRGRPLVSDIESFLPFGSVWKNWNDD